VSVGRVRVEGAGFSAADARRLERRVSTLVSSPGVAPTPHPNRDRVDELAQCIAAQITSELGRRS
jgi:hypothetical protein